MSDKELSDAEYDAMLAQAQQSEDISTHPDTSVNPDEDDDEAAPRPYATRYPAMRKLIEMQHKLTSTVLSVKTEAKDQASCARAWKELEMLRRIMMGKHISVEPAKSKERKPASPMLSLDAAPTEQAA